VQTYKKVLLFLLIITFFGINEGCHKKIIPTTYPSKPGFFPITIPFKAYRLKRKQNKEKNKLSKIEKKKNEESEKNKREELKSQERDRKEFIKHQTPKVQERMKKSFEESEKTRHHKTFWEKLMFWKKEKSREKKI
jgi:hypothetical protein